MKHLSSYKLMYVYISLNKTTFVSLLYACNMFLKPSQLKKRSLSIVLVLVGIVLIQYYNTPEAF